MLSDLKIGESARILRFENSDSVKKRLNDLGLSVGVKIMMVRLAPFYDPFEIKVRDFYLAIRKSEADKIVMVKE